MRHIASGNKQSFEYMISLLLNNTQVTLVMIYHPPYSKRNPVITAMFVDDFSQFLPDILTDHKNVIVLGDFNLHLDTDDSDTGVFSDIVDAMGLIPHVNISTHKAGHTLDQIYTTVDSQVMISNCRQGLLLSDHFIIQGSITIPTNVISKWTIKSRKLKDIDTDAFMADINCEVIQLTNLQQATTTLKDELTRVLEKHAPLKEWKISDRKKQPWYEEHVKHQKKIVRRREHIWHKYKEQQHWKAYTVERNRFNRILAGSKIRTISAKVKECGNDTKRLYNLVNNITGRV